MLYMLALGYNNTFSQYALKSLYNHGVKTGGSYFTKGFGCVIRIIKKLWDLYLLLLLLLSISQQIDFSNPPPPKHTHKKNQKTKKEKKRKGNQEKATGTFMHDFLSINFQNDVVQCHPTLYYLVNPNQAINKLVILREVIQYCNSVFFLTDLQKGVKL